jgi:DNA-binding CsgD family transcriptional regulator
LNHTSTARLAETYAETRAFLEAGATILTAGSHADLRTAVPRTPKRHPKQLSPDEVDEVVAAYQTGLTLNAVAVQFAIHRSTVAAHLQRRGIAQHDRKLMSQALTLQATDLRSQGLSYLQTAERLGVDKMTVWRALNS